MRRVLAAASLAVVLAALPTTAWAVPSTQVIQGSVLRLVSVADWEAAADLLPGQPVRWDVAVSANAPDPGVVRIAVSATGDARLLLDISLCSQAWTPAGCPGGANELRTAWSIPRDGVEVPLAEIADTETAHVRLDIVLDPADGSGSTDVRVLAQGAGETVSIGSDGGLATTGTPPGAPWAMAAGAALVLWGASLVLRHRREAARDEERAP